MTSPGIEKPSSNASGFESVHSRGSSFGQGLTEKGIRELLQGPGKNNPFTNLINEVGNIVTEIGTGLYNAAAELFDWDLKPQSPLWKEFSSEAFKALEPIHSMADQALDDAGTAREKAENLTEDLTGSIDGDFTDAIDNYKGALGRLAQSVDDVSATIPDVTQAAEAVAAAQDAVEDALDELNIEISRVEQLSGEVGEANETYQAQVEAANAAAKRVEDAAAVYSSKVSEAERLLESMAATQKATSNAAQEVQGLVGTPEWDEAVTGFIYWQNQLNEENSDFKKGVTSALAALQMVQDRDSDFNKAVQDALDAQKDINSKQKKFNDGVQASLAALAMVDEKDSDFNRGVQKAIDALETFATLQDKVNEDVKSALQDLSGIADASMINWQTTAEYIEQNNKINSAFGDALALHENQLTWIQETRNRRWAFYTENTHTREPWVSVRLRKPLGTNRVEFTALGAWQGHVAVTIYYTNDATDFHDWVVDSDVPSQRYTFWDAYAPGPTIRNVEVEIFPAWGTRKREYLLRSDGKWDNEVNGYGLLETSAYHNDIEGEPLEWNGHRSSVRFMGPWVKADVDGWVHHPSDGKYHFAPKGTTIPSTFWFRSDEDRLVKFTEA